MLNKFEGSVEFLRFPEYFQLISSEKYQWWIYITSERIICQNNLHSIRGAFELMDHLDNNATVVVVEPTGRMETRDVFKLVEKRKKASKEFVLAFQIAYSRISSISVSKVEQKKTGTPIPGGIELWYKDSIEAQDSQIVLYPTNLSFEKPYDIALNIHKNALEEKLKCTEKKKQIDSSFGKGDYNSWKSTLSRLLKKPDMLAQGSGSFDTESWDPLIFQTHPIQWLEEVFSRSIKPDDSVHSSM